MIYFREGDIKCSVKNKRAVSAWINSIIKNASMSVGDLCVVSCSDEYLHKTNVEHLNHDYYTDIITFDYCENSVVSGDLLISFDRVAENAKDNGVEFREELRRVIVHGVFHLLGFKDKTEKEVSVMREKENQALKTFHVEQN